MQQIQKLDIKLQKKNFDCCISEFELKKDFFLKIPTNPKVKKNEQTFGSLFSWVCAYLSFVAFNLRFNVHTCPSSKKVKICVTSFMNDPLPVLCSIQSLIQCSSSSGPTRYTRTSGHPTPHHISHNLEKSLNKNIVTRQCTGANPINFFTTKGKFKNAS